MDLGGLEVQIFVTLVVVLGAAFVALVCDYLKGNNEQLRERNIELLVRRDEQERRALLDPMSWLDHLKASATGVKPEPAASAARPEPVAETVRTEERPARPEATPVRPQDMMTSWASPDDLKAAAERAAAIAARARGIQPAPKPEPVEHIEPVKAIAAPSPAIDVFETSGRDGAPVYVVREEVAEEQTVIVPPPAPAPLEETVVVPTPLAEVQPEPVAEALEETVFVPPPSTRRPVIADEDLPEGVRQAKRELAKLFETLAERKRQEFEGPRKTEAAEAPAEPLALDNAIDSAAEGRKVRDWQIPGVPANVTAMPSEPVVELDLQAELERVCAPDFKADLEFEDAEEFVETEAKVAAEDEAPVIRVRNVEEPVYRPARTEMPEDAVLITDTSSPEPEPVIEVAPVVAEVPVVEEVSVAEEAAVVEEASLVEEAPVMVEEPVVAEAPVVEEPVAVAEEPVVVAEEPMAAPQRKVVSLTPGMNDRAAYDEALRQRAVFTGVVVAIGITDFQKVKTSLDPVELTKLLAAIDKMLLTQLQKEAAGFRYSEDQWVLTFPNETSVAAQRRINAISERLWDFQLRSLGVASIMFCWGGVHVSGEHLADAIPAAMDRMNQNSRSRRPANTDAMRAPRRIVNG